ncbi:TlpA family protein disulfide reductase [Rhodoferax saidenbachensis]|uniref:Thioredoxin domain-containing protein n=1 Tax=Rhodoferax saidenbachensis TaxID=1484693 RepID=A0A1P8KAI8_9BURK|nr:TlpA disulfide reductase family protein [Rhodoferax saidenbachensis]APW43017.1 hypothetical protein RS694_11050 [Rhodoferax saidenbachensis]
MPKKFLTIAQFLAATLLCSPGATWAQTKADVPSAARFDMAAIQGKTLSGETLSSTRIQGKVTVVFYWSTACTVCMNSLPELRANADGWRNKPFVLVTVNLDRNAADWQAYEKIVAQMQAPSPGLISVRPSELPSTLARLPLVLLVDAQGKVVSRYEGRLAPEVWDGVADLLP